MLSKQVKQRRRNNRLRRSLTTAERATFKALGLSQRVVAAGALPRRAVFITKRRGKRVPLNRTAMNDFVKWVRERDEPFGIDNNHGEVELLKPQMSLKGAVADAGVDAVRSGLGALRPGGRIHGPTLAGRRAVTALTAMG